MDFKLHISLVAFGGLFFAFLHGTNGTVSPFPEQGFFMAARYPETGRSSILHIYALDTFARGGEYVITKDGGLPSNGIQTGEVVSGDDTFGCFLRVFQFNRMRGLRYGLYKGSLTLGDESVLNGYTMVKPKTGILDTRGIQTVTIYPESVSSPDLEEPISIGVGWSPGCRKIKWDKGKRSRVNTGPRMTLTSTEDAGLYTLRRRTRAKRGWFVQILVIASTCPEHLIYSIKGGVCASTELECINGGVLMDSSDKCTCPPFLAGGDCGCAATYDGEDLPLADGLTCGDLPGGDPKCKGLLVCYGGRYGCKCASGWWGNACDRACPKGRWGVDCSQRCPDSESDCNRFWGPTTNLVAKGCIAL